MTARWYSRWRRSSTQWTPCDPTSRRITAMRITPDWRPSVGATVPTSALRSSKSSRASWTSGSASLAKFMRGDPFTSIAPYAFVWLRKVRDNLIRSHANPHTRKKKWKSRIFPMLPMAHHRPYVRATRDTGSTSLARFHAGWPTIYALFWLSTVDHMNASGSCVKSCIFSLLLIRTIAHGEKSNFLDGAGCGRVFFLQITNLFIYFLK